MEFHDRSMAATRADAELRGWNFPGQTVTPI
jgi:hypothetical protein